jgi:hypothetical protein
MPGVPGVHEANRKKAAHARAKALRCLFDNKDTARAPDVANAVSFFHWAVVSVRDETKLWNETLCQIREGQRTRHVFDMRVCPRPGSRKTERDVQKDLFLLVKYMGRYPTHKAMPDTLRSVAALKFAPRTSSPHELVRPTNLFAFSLPFRFVSL